MVHILQNSEETGAKELFGSDHKSVIGYVSGITVRSIDCEMFLPKTEYEPMCIVCGGKFKTNLLSRDSKLVFEKQV